MHKGDFVQLATMAVVKRRRGTRLDDATGWVLRSEELSAQPILGITEAWVMKLWGGLCPLSQ
jgi:hypothetical protein